MDALPQLDARMPSPTHDVDQLKRDLDAFGFCFIKDFLGQAQVAALKQRLAEQAQAEREACAAQLVDESGSRVGGPPVEDPEDWNNQVVRNLLNKGDLFHPLVLDPRLNAVLGHGFQELGYYLLSYQGIVRKKGSAAQVIHSDQMWVPDQTSVPYVINTMVMLSDFTDANGGTRMVPRSHRYGRYPPATPKGAGQTGVLGIVNSEPIETVAVECPAGTAMVFEGRVWHGAGECRADERRYAVTLYFGLDFMRQMDNVPASLHPEVYARMPEALKDRIGYGAKVLGRIEPQVPGGVTNTNQAWPYTPLMRPKGELIL